eukprot:UN23860
MRDIFMGINYLHEQRIAHGDIKPDNILMGVDGHLKLADFGVSRFIESASVIKGLETTPAFQAPEELQGNYSPWPADLWAVGVVFYMFLTGKHPFLGSSIPETYDNIRTKHPKLPVYIDDKAQSDLLFGLLQKNPVLRFNLKTIKNHPWITNNGHEKWVDSIEIVHHLDSIRSSFSQHERRIKEQQKGQKAQSPDLKFGVITNGNQHH